MPMHLAIKCVRLFKRSYCSIAVRCNQRDYIMYRVLLQWLFTAYVKYIYIHIPLLSLCIHGILQRLYYTVFSYDKCNFYANFYVFYPMAKYARKVGTKHSFIYISEVPLCRHVSKSTFMSIASLFFISQYFKSALHFIDCWA